MRQAVKFYNMILSLSQEREGTGILGGVEFSKFLTARSHEMAKHQ